MAQAASQLKKKAAEDLNAAEDKEKEKKKNRKRAREVKKKVERAQWGGGERRRG